MPVDPDFVGRDAELDRLLTLLETATAPAGQACAVLVTGAPGVGKSRLLSAFKRRVRAARAPVLEGRCRPTDTRPHGPLLDLLGATSTLLSDLGRPAPCTERALGLVAGLSPAGALGPDRGDRQLVFFEAVRQALIEAAAVLPSVLILHDLHHADATTLATLRYLLDNLLADPAFETATPTPPRPPPGGPGTLAPPAPERPRFRGLLVLSFRPTEGTRGLVDLCRQGAAVEHLPLGPLEVEGVRAWLSSDRVARQFLAASGGQPAALQQILETLPTDPAQAWQRRFAPLDADERAVLDVLAVFDRPVAPAQVAALAHVEPEAIAATVARLVASGLAERLLDRGQFALRLRGSATREAYQSRLAPERRAALHRAIAEAWAGAGTLAVDPGEIARHFLAAGDPVRAVPFALSAARRAFDAFAFLRAAELLAAIAPAVEGAQRHRILDELALARAHAGQHAEARAVLDALAGSLAPHAPAAAALAARRAQQALLDGDAAAALALAEGALGPDRSPGLDEGLPAPLDPALRLELLATAAEAAYALGAYDRVLVLARGDADGVAGSADVLVDPGAGDAVTQGAPAALTLRNAAGKVYLVRERFDEAQACFALNLAAATAAQLADHEARALINLGVVHLQRGEADAALERFGDARARCQRGGNLRLLAIAVENLAVLHHRRHEYARAIDEYQQSSAAARQLGQRGHVATSALNLADLYLTLGDAERARRLAHIARGIIRGHRLHWLEAQLLALEGEISRSEGDLEAAAEQLQAALGLHERGEGSNQRLAPLLRALAEVNIDLGRLGAAAELLDRALALPAAQGEAVAAGLRLVRGALELARQEPEAARITLEVTAGLAQEAGDPELHWQTLARLAEAHWAAGHRADTLQALAAAVDAVERAGARLPPEWAPVYFATPARRRVRDALRRVRAGLAPFGGGRADDQEARPRAGGFRPVWARRYPEIIGRAPALLPVFNALDRVAGSDSQVLIRGESGTGKELVAAALHTHSPRAPHAFVKVNCAAFVETLLLSELFGHEKGAFTGAVTTKKGRFELAHRGTLFLDEIGDISPNTQVALLRVLQEGTFERVGGHETHVVDVRVVCATHRNLEEMVQRGAFRADLYYRLRGVIIEVPALRERRADIPLLVEHFLDRRPNAAARPLRFTRPALASLLQHEWPGNVRELENVIRSVALFTDGGTIGLAELAELGDLFHPPDEQALLDLSDLLVAAPELASITVAPSMAGPRPPPRAPAGSGPSAVVAGPRAPAPTTAAPPGHPSGVWAPAAAPPRAAPTPDALPAPDAIPASGAAPPSAQPNAAAAAPASTSDLGRAPAHATPGDADEAPDDDAEAWGEEGADEEADDASEDDEPAPSGVRVRTASAEGSPLDNGWLAAMLIEEGSLSNLKRRIEFEAIARALDLADGNITRAAEKLGMKRPRLSQIIHADPNLGEIKRKVDKR